MGLKSFLKLVEIKTKAASMTPFCWARFCTLPLSKVQLVNFLLMLVSFCALIWQPQP